MNNDYLTPALVNKQVVKREEGGLGQQLFKMQ